MRVLKFYVRLNTLDEETEPWLKYLLFEIYGKNLCFLNGGHTLSRYFSQKFQTTEMFSSMVCTNSMSRGLTNALYLVI